ncbi:MAG TPA: peptidoglycan DD-metalloendopeptidase family protein [Candidatus Paceibacterota bacterium]|nr:peptidoglycan DD-metalloendopeptidase family protein [Candidatus Paceibacterota bacterium]
MSGTAEASSTHSDDTAAVSDSDNVQTMTLLTPATNLDPSQLVVSAPMVVDGSALIPADGPSGTTADLQEKTKNGIISVYVVRPGDTLSGIAGLFGVPQSTILWANDLTEKSIIQPGETLTILPVAGITYTVKDGDTLESIAKANGGDAADIGAYNGVDDSTLAVGTQIIIPEGETGAIPEALPTTESPSTPSKTKKKSSGEASVASNKVVASSKILEGQYASGDVIPLSNNPAEPARGVGPVGSTAEIDYYTSPLVSFIQTQNIHGYNAVDLAAPAGTPILAAAAGEVIVAKQGGWNGGYGSYVVIQHDNGSQTLYAHMSLVEATVGEDVAQGQVIGKVGMTGNATGPHVHFEIRNGIRNPF